MDNTLEYLSYTFKVDPLSKQDIQVMSLISQIMFLFNKDISPENLVAICAWFDKTYNPLSRVI